MIKLPEWWKNTFTKKAPKKTPVEWPTWLIEISEEAGHYLERGRLPPIYAIEPHHPESLLSDLTYHMDMWSGGYCKFDYDGYFHAEYMHDWGDVERRVLIQTGPSKPGYTVFLCASCGVPHRALTEAVKRYQLLASTKYLMFEAEVLQAVADYQDAQRCIG